VAKATLALLTEISYPADISPFKEKICKRHSSMNTPRFIKDIE